MKLEELIKAQGRLNEKEFLIYNSELKKNLKSTWKAYFFLLFFGWFGFHKFYLGKIGDGILYLIVGQISLNADFNLDEPNFSTLTFLALVIRLIYDLFTIPSNISKHEINLRIELFGKFGIFFNKFNMEIDDLSEAENTLSEKDFLKYNLLLEKKIINVELAYFSLFFCGWIGLHKFYLGKILEGIAYLFMFFAGVYVLVRHVITGAPIYHLYFIIYICFLILDSIFLYSEVYVHNQELRKELLAQFGIFIKFKNKKEQYEKEFKNSLDDLIQACDIIGNFKKNYNDLKKEQFNFSEDSIAESLTENSNQFFDYENGIVMSKTSGLMWQRFCYGQIWINNSCEGKAIKMNVIEAKKCRSSFAGYNDWRIPTSNELSELFPTKHEGLNYIFWSIESINSKPNIKKILLLVRGLNY